MSEPALRLSDITVQRGDRLVLEDVSFVVEQGEFCCLCGPNGGGKTTLLRVILGLVPADKGTLEVLGRRPQEARPAIGYLPQAKAFNPSFPARALELVLANHKGRWPLRLSAAERELGRAALAEVGGQHLAEAPIRSLSGGELQRVYLARALVKQPPLLLLDEPTAGLDARGRAEFLELLERLGSAGERAFVLVTHNAAAARRLARRVVYLDGRVQAWGPPAEVLERAADAFSGHDHEAPAGVLCEEE